MFNNRPVNQDARASNARSYFFVCLVTMTTVVYLGCSQVETTSDPAESPQKEVSADQPKIQKDNDPGAMLDLKNLAAKNELFRWSLEFESKSVGHLYVFNEEDFEFPYAMDLPSQSKQSRQKYLEWIPSFYEGNIISSGWNSNAKKRIGDLKSKTVASYFNVIGRVIAAECPRTMEFEKSLRLI